MNGGRQRFSEFPKRYIFARRSGEPDLAERLQRFLQPAVIKLLARAAHSAGCARKQLVAPRLFGFRIGKCATRHPARKLCESGTAPLPRLAAVT
jgi:hypothetical protein